MMIRPRPVFPPSDKVQEALRILILEHGGDQHALWARDTYRPLADFFQLTDEERTIQRHVYGDEDHSEACWNTQVQGARKNLVRIGDLDPKPNPHRTGIWQLTEQGRCRAKQLTAGRPRVAFALRTPITPVSAWHLTNPPPPPPPKHYFTLEELGLRRR